MAKQKDPSGSFFIPAVLENPAILARCFGVLYNYPH